MKKHARPLLVVVSAPSGAGKTTLCQRLLSEFPNMLRSISCTTRLPRDGEVDGKDYRFVTEREFERLRKAGEFLEHAVVHGYKYGTPRANVVKALAGGRDIIMAIDVQGAAQIRAAVRKPGNAFLRSAYVDVFLAPPSREELRRRLVNRGLDSRETIAARLRNAVGEMAEEPKFQYRFVNDELDEAYNRLRSIVVAEHFRTMP